jgi:hypothetical protein
MTLFPVLHCPHCASRLERQRIQLGFGKELLIAFFGDWPFWLMFAVGVRWGLSHQVAGVMSAVAMGIGVWVWVRRRSTYRCSPCGRTFKYVELG